MIALVLACVSSQPTSCDALCDVAVDALESCLADEGQVWTAAGYDSRGDFSESCQAWAVELTLLQRSATRRGDADGSELAGACAAERDRVEAEPDACTAYDAIDWSEDPW